MLHPHQTREKPIEPGTLFLGERSRAGNEFRHDESPSISYLKSGMQHEFLQFRITLSRRERREVFIGIALLQITSQQSHQHISAFVVWHRGEQLPPDRLPRPPASTDVDVIAFDHFVPLLHLAGEQADIADIVLRTTMMAPRKMDIEGLVEFNLRFEIPGNFQSMPFRVRGGILATGVSRSGNEAGTETVGFAT